MTPPRVVDDRFSAKPPALRPVAGEGVLNELKANPSEDPTEDHADEADEERLRFLGRDEGRQ